MKSSISVQQIIDEAAKHDGIAARLRGIAESLKGLNPNVLICIPEAKEHASDSGGQPKKEKEPEHEIFMRGFETATKLESVMLVLKNAGPKPMEKSEILAALAAQHVSIEPETLSSYLSRNKGIFKKQGHGLWKLVDAGSALERDDPT